MLNEVQAAIREILDAIQNRDDLTKEDTRLDEPGKFLYGIDLVKNENECCFYFYEHLCQICSFFPIFKYFSLFCYRLIRPLYLKSDFFCARFFFLTPQYFFHLFCLKCMIKNFLSEGLMKNLPKMACEERPPGLKDHCILYAEMLIDF